MKTFYSIFYAAIRPEIDERVSIALLVKGDRQIFFKYSLDKLAAVEKLMPRQAFNLLKRNLNNFSNFVAENNSLYSINIESETIFQEHFFHYLSNYANGILTYSKPTTINLPGSVEVMKRLYQKFVSSSDKTKIEKKLTGIQLVRTRLESEIRPHVNLDFELTSSEIPNLEIPTRVWFIGKNERNVTGETIDFSKQYNYLNNELRSYLYLADRLDENDNRFGKYFLVGKEPDKTLEKQHLMWSNIRQNKRLEYLELDQVEVINNYINDHNVAPFVTE